VTALTQLAIAETVADAEEMLAILSEAGIEAQLEAAVEHHPRDVEDIPQKVLVPEEDLEAAKDAIITLGDPDLSDELP
jgi:type III secretory pathway lipoprotein EscJ